METIRIPAIRLFGLKLKTKTWNQSGQSAIDCGLLWQQFEKENLQEKIPGKLDDERYSVYFEYEGDHTQPYSYFIGCPVESGIEKPEFLDEIFIPEGIYKKHEAKGVMPDCIAQVWREIWSSDLNRAYTFDYEKYDERSADWNNAEADVYVALK